MKFKIQDLPVKDFIALLNTLKANNISFVFNSKEDYIITVSDEDYTLIQELIEANSSTKSLGY